MMLRKIVHYGVAAVLAAGMLSSCGGKRYENRITKDTQQPDKVLFDQAIGEIEKSRYERARLYLQTLMNTYDTSEYMAKAKLALADSWFREGGAHGYAQAEAEYKDFILFYPQMEEAAEAQVKVCDMQYKQLEKADRDPTHALRAEEECRQLLVQFPNSKFAPEAQQRLRDIQEVLAEKEFKVGMHYLARAVPVSAANRLQATADQFPLFSKADEALWQAAVAYQRLGDRFENQQANAYTRIVKDYPLSEHAEEAKAKLTGMNRPIPEADPVAYARMKYEIENHTGRSVLNKAWGPFSGRPDMSNAAKSGSPQMTGFRPTVPVSVPATAAGTATSGEVIAVQPDTNVIDQRPDARVNPGAAGTTGNTGTTGATPAATDAKPETETPASTTAPAKKDSKKNQSKKKNEPKPAKQ